MWDIAPVNDVVCLRATGNVQRMAFVSVQFLVFFSAVAIAYFTLPVKFRWLALLAASIYYYATAGLAYLGVIGVASLLTFWFALAIEQTEAGARKRLMLAAIICVVAANLAVFKYLGFINDVVHALASKVGLHYEAPQFSIIAPLGVSFYSLQLIAYVVDVARGEKAERGFGRFLLFVLYFPKIISGPIERGRSFLPQIVGPHLFDAVRIVAGLELVVWGLFKKLVVADRIAPFVDRFYDHPYWFSGVELVLATFLYAFQLYFDFSGYTDMAIGGALILGYRLTENFNRPYFATSIQDFWKRWHISLTSWLTDYIYTPLSRSTWVKIKWRDWMLVSLS